MAVAKLTKSVVDRLPPGAICWDQAVNGFGIRVGKGKHFLLRYRVSGKQTFRSIGRYGSPWTVDTARNEAIRLLGLLAGGADLTPVRNEGAIFGEQAQRYLSLRVRDNRYGTMKILRYHLLVLAKPLHLLVLAEINRLTIAELLGVVEVEHGPVQRNRCRASLSAFWNWLIREGLLEANVVAGTGKAAENNSRDRVLTQEEIRKLWAALGSDAWSDSVRLLLLTGQRKNEIAELRWSEVDFDRRLIVLPAERVKNGREHTLPLSKQALAILKGISRSPSGRENDGRVFAGMSWANRKDTLDARLGIAHWIIHDLRRTCATGMIELGELPHIVEAVLNHLSGHKASVAGIYNRATYFEPMRDALQKWADHLDVITK